MFYGDLLMNKKLVKKAAKEVKKEIEPSDYCSFCNMPGAKHGGKRDDAKISTRITQHSINVHGLPGHIRNNLVGFTGNALLYV